MDGGTGTEIQRRGHAMDAEVWSGLAHMADPIGVRQIHEDYIRAGAEIIIANTFSTARSMLASKGWVTISRRSTAAPSDSQSRRETTSPKRLCGWRDRSPA